MLSSSRTRTSSGRSRHMTLKPTLVHGLNNRPQSGNSKQIFEKYITLAEDFTSKGDRVMAEGCYQHADHYLRLMNAQLNEKSVIVVKNHPETTGSEGIKEDCLSEDTCEEEIFMEQKEFFKAS